MKVTLVGHASLLVRTADCTVWTDPWLHGKAFNDSWSLIAPPVLPESALDEIDFLWISHEHPDHFHVPTLRSLPASFRERVTVLFQQNNSEKMFRAFHALGFPRHRPLPDRRVVELRGETRAYCYQVLPMDSALAILSEGKTLLDVNDAEMNDRDCRRVLSDLGPIDAVANQFSIAGYSGLADRDRHLPELAERVLRNVSDNHRALEARTSIPIASFVYFSTRDNRYVNRYANTPRDAADALRAQGQDCTVLFHGDEWEVGSPQDSEAALARWDAVYAGVEGLPCERAAPVPFEEIERVFRERVVDLRDKYPRWVLRALGPVLVRIPDLDRTIRLSIAEGSLAPAEGEADLEIQSQPLHFAFAEPFGVQTLGVSARLRVERDLRAWRLHRIFFSMYNAEIYLRPRHFFTRDNLRYLRRRLRGGWSQLSYRLALMR
jgi:UDP-MurNAc hydroxylase